MKSGVAKISASTHEVIDAYGRNLNYILLREREAFEEFIKELFEITDAKDFIAALTIQLVECELDWSHKDSSRRVKREKKDLRDQKKKDLNVTQDKEWRFRYQKLKNIHYSPEMRGTTVEVIQGTLIRSSEISTIDISPEEIMKTVKAVIRNKCASILNIKQQEKPRPPTKKRRKKEEDRYEKQNLAELTEELVPYGKPDFDPYDRMKREPSRRDLVGAGKS